MNMLLETGGKTIFVANGKGKTQWPITLRLLKTKDKNKGKMTEE